MHTYAIDIVRQNGERAQARAERGAAPCGRPGAQASPASRRR